MIQVENIDGCDDDDTLVMVIVVVTVAVQTAVVKQCSSSRGSGRVQSRSSPSGE